MLTDEHRTSALQQQGKLGWGWGAGCRRLPWDQPLTPGVSSVSPNPPLPWLFLIRTPAPQEWPSLLGTSESGDSSEMLWDVAERGVEGPRAEAVAEGVAVV